MIFNAVNGALAWLFTPTRTSIGTDEAHDLVLEAGRYVTGDLNVRDAPLGAVMHEGPRILGPGQTTAGPTCMFTPRQLLAVREGRARSVALLRATYLDPWNSANVTEHCDVLSGVGGNMDDPDESLRPGGFPCKNHDCTDDECSAAK